MTLGVIYSKINIGRFVTTETTTARDDIQMSFDFGTDANSYNSATTVPTNQNQAEVDVSSSLSYATDRLTNSPLHLLRRSSGLPSGGAYGSTPQGLSVVSQIQARMDHAAASLVREVDKLIAEAFHNDGGTHLLENFIYEDES